MTTNVLDVSAGVFASDSRWSYEEGGWLAYIDDTGYDKIIADDVLGFLFAGSIISIDAWKNWVLMGRPEPAPFDCLDAMSIMVVELATGAMLFNSDYMLHSKNENSVEAWYAGSGAPYAKDCWQVRRCARTAVGTAKSQDDFSGGETKFFERVSRSNNVMNCATIAEVMEQFKERGFLMNVKAPIAPMRVKDAANDPTNPVAQTIAQKVMQGKAALGAPFPGIQQPWTNEKKLELAAVLKRFSSVK